MHSEPTNHHKIDSGLQPANLTGNGRPGNLLLKHRSPHDRDDNIYDSPQSLKGAAADKKLNQTPTVTQLELLHSISRQSAAKDSIASPRGADSPTLKKSKRLDAFDRSGSGHKKAPKSPQE